MRKESSKVLPIVPSAPADAECLDVTYGFDFALIEQAHFRPARSRHEVIAFKKKDIPAKQFDLRIAERRPSEIDDFIWAFACYHNEPNMIATELAPFGPRCASIAVVIWHGSEDIATFGVGTEELLRGQGYALAVVSAATQWILDQQAIAWYGAYANNISSLRIARRLGFSPIHQSFRA